MERARERNLLLGPPPLLLLLRRGQGQRDQGVHRSLLRFDCGISHFFGIRFIVSLAVTTKQFIQFQCPLQAMPLLCQVSCTRNISACSRLLFPGNHGVVTLLNPATRSSIGSITCNGSVRACSFTSDGSKLLCGGNEGLV